MPIDIRIPDLEAVISVANVDGTLTISPTTDAVIASLNLAKANTWIGQQTFSTSPPLFSTMTSGSVLFAGVGGVLSQDNAHFNYVSEKLSIVGTFDGGTQKILSVRADGGGTNVLDVYDAQWINFNATLRYDSDNTWDIGGSISTFRPRDLWLGRNAYVGGKLGINITPSSTIMASILGSSATTEGLLITTQAYSTEVSILKLQDHEGSRTLFNVTSTIDIDFGRIDIGANMKFTTDATFDIGSISFRPKDIYSSSLANTGVLFSNADGLITENASFFNWDSTNQMLSITTASTSTSCLSLKKTAHTSTLNSAISVIDENNRETVGLTGWSGGGGAGGYGAIVTSGYGNAVGYRIGEVSAKNSFNGYRLMSLITDIDSATDRGKCYLLTGVGGGAFRYAWYSDYKGKISINGGESTTLLTPTAKLHLRAGTTAATDAPLKFSSGSLMTTAEIGAMEFLTDRLYFSTGASARKEIVLNDGTNLTSGRVPFCTTNGRLTDDADLTFSVDTLTATKFSGALNGTVGATTPSSGVFTSLQVDSITNDTGLAAGTYTPVRSAEVNITGTVTIVGDAQYLQVGNTVTVSGSFTATATVATIATSFEITLPVASNIGAVEDLAGVAFCGNIASMGAAITGSVVNNTAVIFWKATDITSQTWSYTFSYQII